MPNAQIPVFHKGKQQAVHSRENPKEDAGQRKIQAACGFSASPTHSCPSPHSLVLKERLDEKYIV